MRCENEHKPLSQNPMQTKKMIIDIDRVISAISEKLRTQHSDTKQTTTRASLGLLIRARESLEKLDAETPPWE